MLTLKSLLGTFFALVLLAGCITLPIEAGRNTTADVLIRNGRVIDGTGNSWFIADVAIRDGRIAAIGRLDHFTAVRTIDAARQIVAPGFIDVHGHIEFGLFENPNANNYVQDGVTTVITGNCGGSADSLKEFFSRIERSGSSINVASLVGHNTVRRLVLGLANRSATTEEQVRMQSLVEDAMKQGAVGLSTGLIYLPGMYSNTEEIVGLAKSAAKHNGLYASHIRDEANIVVEAINEALSIGRVAKMPVQISHFKVTSPANWGRAKETLAMVEQARRDGLDVTIDQYPYTATSTSLGVLLPDWALEGGGAVTRQRLADDSKRQQVVRDTVENARAKKYRDFSYAVVANHAADASINGKSISEINRLKGRAGTMELEAETILELYSAGGALMVYHAIDEADVRTIMKFPFSMIAADGWVQDGKGMPHPRSYGTNARVLGKYVREEKIISLEDAIRRMTSLAAQKFQLKDRGLLREGFAADIVIFDEREVIDKATFEKPHQFSAGISHVLVNGKVVVDAGRHTGMRSGIALKGPGFSPGS